DGDPGRTGSGPAPVRIHPALREVGTRPEVRAQGIVVERALDRGETREIDLRVVDESGTATPGIAGRRGSRRRRPARAARTGSQTDREQADCQKASQIRHGTTSSPPPTPVTVYSAPRLGSTGLYRFPARVARVAARSTRRECHARC